MAEVIEHDDGRWEVRVRGRKTWSGTAEEVSERIDDWIRDAAADLQVGLKALQAWRREGPA